MDALAVSAILNYLRVEKGLSSNTIGAYGRDLKRFSAYLEKRRPKIEDLCSGTISSNISRTCTSRSWIAAPWRDILCTLRGFYKFLLIEDVDQDRPDADFGVAEVPAHAAYPSCALDEVDKLLQQPDLNTPRGLRDRAILELLYSSGLRASELTGLRVSDVDFRTGTVRCIGKGDKERLVPIGRRALVRRRAVSPQRAAADDASARRCAAGAVSLHQPAGRPI